jgi:hypothetical protein
MWMGQIINTPRLTTLPPQMSVAAAIRSGNPKPITSLWESLVIQADWAQQEYLSTTVQSGGFLIVMFDTRLYDCGSKACVKSLKWSLR